MAKNDVVRAGRPSAWAVGVLALSVVTGLSLRIAYSQDTPPAADVHPLSDTWKGDKLDPKWNVTVLGDSQNQENSVKVENGTLRLRAGGSDIWGGTDNGLYIWQVANGDFEITLEHRSLDRTDPSSKAGIMVRSSLDVSSANSFLQVMPKGGAFQSRLTNGATETGPGSGCPGAECNPWGNPDEDDPNRPVILQRLTRTGKTLKAERSYDAGKTWVGLRTGSIAVRDLHENVEMPDDVLVGIALTSHNTGQEAEAVVGPITFRQIALRPTGAGLVAATATGEDGKPVADTGLEVLKGTERLGTSVNEDSGIISNTASFFLAPGAYTVRAAENDTYAAGAPQAVDLKTGDVKVLNAPVGAAK
jgi:hypothetical protein